MQTTIAMWNSLIKIQNSHRGRIRKFWKLPLAKVRDLKFSNLDGL